jgi:hypothetical protein
MAKGFDSKLNQLQQLPEGFLADAAWLERHGYSSSLRSQYVKAGWLHQPARRVYRRASGPLTWEQAVTSLQVLLDYPLTVGGRNALEAQGYAHYLSSDVRTVHLYGPKRPPTWLDELPLDVKFEWHNSRRLFPNELVPERDTGASENSVEGRPRLVPGGFMVQNGGQVSWPVRYSSPERAILEMLDELPDRESFYQADTLMGQVTNLRPGPLQTLLETCKSVKVKRLFFYFADRHRHAWLAKLDRSTIDLGAGKRALVKGGKLDPRYQITVPGDLDAYS